VCLRWLILPAQNVENPEKYIKFALDSGPGGVYILKYKLKRKAGYYESHS